MAQKLVHQKGHTGLLSRSLWFFTLVFLCTIFFLMCRKEEVPSDTSIKPGRYELSIEVDSVLRWYTIIIPTGYDHIKKRPLVLAFHPGNANMSEFIDALSGFLDSAEEENWLVVFPNGRNQTDNRTGECVWNAVHCCGLAHTQNIDDVGFVKELIDKLQEDYKIDENQIYALGRSNGGMLVHRLGAELWDVFAAIAPFNAAAGGQFTDSDPEMKIEPSHPMPILMMHGINDPNVKFYGGLSSNGLRYDISFAETTAIWLEANSCDQTVSDTTLVETDKGNTWIADFSDCANDAQVVAIAVENSGHHLPRISNSGFDGTNAIVQFFKTH